MTNLSTEITFDAEPLVFGVIGPRSARGGASDLAPDLRVTVDTDQLAIMSNQKLKTWHSGSTRGWYWSPISDIARPRSWDDVQDDAMAPGIANLAQRGHTSQRQAWRARALLRRARGDGLVFKLDAPAGQGFRCLSHRRQRLGVDHPPGFPNTGSIPVRGNKEPPSVLLGTRVKRFGPTGTRVSP